MSRRRHTPEQIIRKLAEGQKLLAGGMTVEDVCREFTIAESTWARWLSQYGGMKADDAKRLKELEGENARLKKLLTAPRPGDYASSISARAQIRLCERATRPLADTFGRDPWCIGPMARTKVLGALLLRNHQ